MGIRYLSVFVKKKRKSFHTRRVKEKNNTIGTPPYQGLTRPPPPLAPHPPPGNLLLTLAGCGL